MNTSHETLTRRASAVAAPLVVLMTIGALAACGGDDPDDPRPDAGEHDAPDAVSDAQGDASTDTTADTPSDVTSSDDTEATDVAQELDLTPDIDAAGDASTDIDIGGDTDAGADSDAGPHCGNGVVDEGEECDDGNLIDDDACANDCTLNTGGACAPCDDHDDCGGDNDLCVALDDGQFCALACPDDGCPEGTTCGDHFDDENVFVGEVCIPDARVCGDCGNGVLDLGEECDDGNLVNGDGCSSLCLIEPYCGDGVLDDGEECDDGNVADDDGCDSECRLEFCGDGIIQSGLDEECDDGASNDDTSGACTTACLLPVCGDGRVHDDEECDDGNLVDGDGCSALCLIEPYCGDGIVQEDEECDDGGTVDGDGCDSDCNIECLPIDVRYASGPNVATGSTVGRLDSSSGTCLAGSSPDRLLHWRAPHSGQWSFDTDGSNFDTALVLFDGVGGSCGGSELGCNDDADGEDEGSSRVAIEVAIGDELLLVVDGMSGSAGDYVLNITAPAVPDSETVASPGASDPRTTAVGSAFWNEGDAVEFEWTTSYESISELTANIVLDVNVLTCDTQDMEVSVNGTPVGTMVIVAGELEQSFDFTFAPIEGPVYTFSYRTTRTVGLQDGVQHHCGSARFDYEASTIEFGP